MLYVATLKTPPTVVGIVWTIRAIIIYESLEVCCIAHTASISEVEENN